jgi:hypothetical protein
MEIALVAVELGEGVARAVKLWELELAGGGGEIAACSLIVVGALPLVLLVRWPRNALGTLRLSQPSDCHV